MGRDKASLVVGSESLLARTLGVLASVAHPVVVVAAPDQAVAHDLAGVELVRDERPHEGPLVALSRGLEALGDRAGQVFVCGTDHPWLSASVVLRLAELARGRGAAIARIDGAPQLLCAIYATGTRDVARRLVAAGERSMKALARELDVREVTPEELLADPGVRSDDPLLRTFLDVDTPEDLERLAREP